jgi:hypothetical protein
LDFVHTTLPDRSDHLPAVFNRSMNNVRKHASASPNAARLNPFESLVMAALVELERKNG